MEEAGGEGDRLLESLPLLSIPPRWPFSPELISVVFVEFALFMDYVQVGKGCRGGCSGVEWKGGDYRAQGHWRRSSVSDRENAITTSSAPWSILCCGSWLI